MRLRLVALAAVPAVLALALASPRGAAAQPAIEFYKGKQVRFVIRAAPGGGYDLYLRLLARHMMRHIPGQPEAIPMNMPGGGGLTALNYTVNVAPSDGTALTMVTSTAPMDQALGRAQGLKIDMRALNWIGNMSDENYFLVTRRDSPIKTLDDAKVHDARLAGTGAGDTQQVLVSVLNSMLGTRFKSIVGYRNSSEMNLAVERGEADGRTTTNLPALFAGNARGADAFNLVLQTGIEKSPHFPTIPLLLELTKTPDQRIVFEFISRAVSLGRPVATGPNVPPERVAILRRAFDRAIKDPELLAEAKRQNLDISPWSGERLESVVTQIVNTPAAELVKIRQAMAGSFIVERPQGK